MKGNEMTEEEVEAQGPMSEEEKAIQAYLLEMCDEPNPIIRNTGETKNGRADRVRKDSPGQEPQQLTTRRPAVACPNLGRRGANPLPKENEC
jgi:hypothetical protein